MHMYVLHLLAQRFPVFVDTGWACRGLGSEGSAAAFGPGLASVQELS